MGASVVKATVIEASVVEASVMEASVMEASVTEARAYILPSCKLVQLLFLGSVLLPFLQLATFS